MEYHSATKERNNAICRNMDGPGDCHIKGSKSDKGKYHIISLVCEMYKKKNIYIYIYIYIYI